MRHIVYEQTESYPLAILIKGAAFNQRSILEHYVMPLEARGLSRRDVVAFRAEYDTNSKATAAFIKSQLAELLPVLQELKTKVLYVADSNYFKVLTGQAKADIHHGYSLPCKMRGFTNIQVVLGINFQALIYNPDLGQKLTTSLAVTADVLQGSYAAPGSGIIHSAHYPQTLSDIRAALQNLKQHPELTCDIEAFSLRFWEAGIATIAFAWNKHNGVAFACDYSDLKGTDQVYGDPYYGAFYQNPEVRALLRNFFETYTGTLTFHNAAYDVKVMVYTLWMKNMLDTEGLLKGLSIMSRAFNDTQIIAYLATNSTAGNILALKALAQEFAGNWAVEVTDVRKVPLHELLQYNLVDALCTWHVRDKYYPIMVADQQQELYETLMLPSQRLIIQIELTGMPMSRAQIAKTRANLEAVVQKHLDTLTKSSAIKAFNLLLQKFEWQKDFEGRKAKAKNPDKIKPKELDAFAAVELNPNSGQQLQKLLYDLMGLPIIDYTDTKQPATGGDTLEKLLNHTGVPEYKEIIEALIGYGKVQKILSAFLPAFERAVAKADDDTVWLHGSFKLGGTVSGRLSSSDPNMQNIPAGSDYGEIIKECFVAPQGWLFAGADFNSLEDYISALTTKDPNKLKVYIDGFDGHCLRAALYFRAELMHIDIADPKSVNSIKKTHPELRQDSKGPTFALTYQGTWKTLVTNLGWPEDKAKQVEAGYHELYKVSDGYVQARLEQATKDGYVTVAFGLRVRTPLLKQVVWGAPKMPYEAAAEGRTAGNALGQSYGLLNNRAAVDFMRKVWASPYRYDIKPVALIHDAIYILIRDDLTIVEWANRELIASMRWQELPEIQHDVVKLGAALDIFWPSWANPITLPNDADAATLRAVCEQAKQEFLHPPKES